jgi:hypothetical protein
MVDGSINVLDYLLITVFSSLIVFIHRLHSSSSLIVFTHRLHSSSAAQVAKDVLDYPQLVSTLETVKETLGSTEAFHDVSPLSSVIARYHAARAKLKKILFYRYREANIVSTHDMHRPHMTYMSISHASHLSMCCVHSYSNASFPSKRRRCRMPMSSLGWTS